MMSTVSAEDLSLYAMRLLDEGDARRVEQYVRQTPEARQELVHIQGDLALLSLAVEPQAVPDTMRQRFLSAVARDAERMDGALVAAGSGHSTATRTAQVQTRRLSSFLPWSGWAVAAALAVATWFTHQATVALQGELRTAHLVSMQAAHASAQAQEASARARNVLETLLSPSAQRFLLTRQNAPSAPSARVAYVPGTGSLVFFGNHLQDVSPAKTYELWLIPADKAAKPIPAGTFKPDARGYANLILPALPNGIPAATFGVTIEDDGGSHTPTLPILLLGS